jgi:hypothetical protein
MENFKNIERFKKLDIIEACYNRDNTIPMVAEKLSMAIKDVNIALNLLNYYKGIRRTSETIVEGKSVNPIILSQQLAFLDKYDMN